MVIIIFKKYDEVLFVIKSKQEEKEKKTTINYPPSSLLQQQLYEVCVVISVPIWRNRDSQLSFSWEVAVLEFSPSQIQHPYSFKLFHNYCIH